MTRLLALIIPLLVLAAALMPQQDAQAVTFNVACDTAELQTAINSANTNGQPDTINLAAGCTYNLSVTVFVQNDPSPVTINGNEATLSGGNAHQVLVVDPGMSVSLDLVTIANGAASNAGGIFNAGTLTISNSRVSSNTASLFEGGGIGNFGALTISGTVFSGNSSTTNGGAVINFASGTMTISNSTFSGNSSGGTGSAIHSDGSTTVSCSAITENTSGSGADVSTAGGTIDAARNWWGAVDGPSGTGPGSGDSIGAGINFAPWLGSAPPPCDVLLTPTPTPTATFTPTFTPTPTPTWTATVTPTPTITSTGTVTPLPTDSETLGILPTSTPTFTPTVNTTPGTPTPSFTPASITIASTSDDRINPGHGDTWAVLYSRIDGNGYPVLQVYCLQDTHNAWLALSVTHSQLAAYPQKPATNIEVARNDACPVSFYILTTGEYQVNIGPNYEGEVRVVIFRGLPPRNVYFRDYNIHD